MAIVFNFISKPNLWAIAKKATVAVAVVLSCSLGVKAEDTKQSNNNAIQVSCNPFANNNIDAQCDPSSYSVVEQESLVAQTRRGRGRKRKSKVEGYYAGFTLGAGFPSGEIEFSNNSGTEFPEGEYSTGFSGSIFGGIKFTRNLAADVELYLGIGGLDTDDYDDFVNDPANELLIVGEYESDGDYSAFAFYINPRFELPLSESGSFSLYISPGIGISQTNVNFESEDEGVENIRDIDDSRTGFTYQVKGGATVAISETIGVFGQLRYTSLPTDDDVDTINIFATEAGLKFNF